MKKAREQEKQSKRINWKKIILTIILILAALITVANWDCFYVTREYNPTTKGEEREIPLEGNQRVEQEFVAVEGEIERVYIRFKAWERKSGTGQIRVSLQTLTGEELASSEVGIGSLVQSKKSDETPFKLAAKLEKGERYIIVIESLDIKSLQGCYLYTTDRVGNNFGQLKVNGSPEEGRIKIRFSLIRFSAFSMVGLLFLIAAVMIFVWIPWGWFQRKLDEKEIQLSLNRLFSRIFFLAAPLYSFMVIQRYYGYGIKKFLKMVWSLRGAMNILLYLLLWLIIYLICNRTKYTAVLMVAVTSLAGLVNFFVESFRGKPIIVADLSSIGIASEVAGGYEYQLNYSALLAVVLAILFCCAVLSLENYKGMVWKKRICVLAAFLIPFGFFYTQLLHGDYLKENKITLSAWDPSRNYGSNGSLLSFFISYTYYRVDKPAGYSPEAAEEIAAQYTSDTPEVKEGQVQPNVIAIMNEAFADLNVDGTLYLTEDYMPFFHGLEENTVKGELYMSVFGGNTANSEFEFLTGCTMGFLPNGAMPYNTYIKEPLPSLTYILKELGYVGHQAMHPYTRASWSRDSVYPLLGFDEYLSQEHYEDAQYVRGFVSDKSDFDKIISQYEKSREDSEEPFYAFNVTMQNHGGYGKTMGLIDTPITFTDPNQQSDDAEQYINLVKMTDEAFQELVEYFEGVEEPTVIVMFGDHQPSLPGSFYNTLFGKTSSLTKKELVRKYTVPYVIWANYDIEEQEADMSANYLSAYMMQVIGGNMTGYQKYLMELYKKVPLITANCYRGDDGKIYEWGEESPYTELLKEYQILQYNNMFDSANRVAGFYSLGGEF